MHKQKNTQIPNVKNIILVVIYNEIITKTHSFNSLVMAFRNCGHNTDNYEIVLWDNSKASINEIHVNEALDTLTGLGVASKYVNTPENLALSKLYNRVIKLYQVKRNYLFILDQDSEFDSGYFTVFEDIIEKQAADVILPIVKFKNQIVSPTKLFYLKGFYYNCAPKGFINSNTVSAINSGMIISLSYIKKHNYRYNELLRNYCTDDDIMQFVRKTKGSVFVMDYSFEHDLSLCTLNANSDSLRARYNEMVRSRKILHSRNIFESVFVNAYFFFHRVYMTLKYKDIKYFKGE